MDLSWLMGKARVSFHHGEKTHPLVLKSGSKTNLADLVKETTPPCYLNPFLFNGHLQTFWTAYKNAGPPITYKRHIFSAEDARFAGTFAVDFVTSSKPDVVDETLPPRTTMYTAEEFAKITSDDSKPMLITLHGLSGGSHEIYLRHVLAPLVTDGEWEALVVNSRGCAMSEITTPILYNARATWDVRQTVRWCRETFPNRPLFAIGYSLGANILTNYLGEEGDQCLLQAAVICSNPWNLEVSNKSLQRTLLGKEIYSKTMADSMKKLFERHKNMVCKNDQIDADYVMSVKYLADFDQAIQCPTWGYPTAGAYHRDASSVDSVLSIRIPCLAVHAEDDPIAVDEAVPYVEIKQNPYMVMCSTSLGGHLSWFEWGGNRWFARPVVNFLNKMAREVDMKRSKASSPALDEKTKSSSYRPPFDFKPMQRKAIFRPL